MKKKIVSVFICIILLLPLVLGNEELSLLEVKNEVIGKELPGPIGILFGNERIQVTIEQGNKEIYVSLITKEKKIENLLFSSLERPTIEFFTDEATIRNIVNEENKIRALEEALEEKKIRYETKSFLKRMKLSFAFFFLKISKQFASKNDKKDGVEV